MNISIYLKKLCAYFVYPLYAAIFCICIQLYIVGQHDQEVIQQAYHLFSQGHYMQASALYDSIQRPGFAVLYNLSICCLHQNKLGQAMVYALRAEKQANYTQLTYLQEIFDYILKIKNPDYQVGWYEQIAVFYKKCILSIPIIILQLLLLLLLIIFILSWYRSWYKQYFKAYYFMFFVVLITFGLWYYRMHLFQEQVGIVLKDSTSLLAGPDESFYKKTELGQADRLILCGVQQKEYYQVKTKHVTGWIHKDDIECV